MKVINKSENWWLRFTIVVISLLSMSIISVSYRNTSSQINKLKKEVLTVTSQRQINDSLTIDSLNRAVDSLQTEIFTLQTINGRNEMGLYYLKERNPTDYFIIKNYIDNLE